METALASQDTLALALSGLLTLPVDGCTLLIRGLFPGHPQTWGG